MHILFTLFASLCCLCATGQAKINLDDVSKHIGDSVIVCGKVVDMRYFETSRNQPTFLNIGAKYPDQKITVVIWGEIRKTFTIGIEELKGKDICITGRIILYKEKAEIIIYRPDQIVIE